MLEVLVAKENNSNAYSFGITTSYQKVPATRYTLLGLLANVGLNHLNVGVDYNLEKEETYLKLAIDILSMNHNLDILKDYYYVSNTYKDTEQTMILSL